jgi:DNA-binding MurR/RpiR family transcriptional regulator/sugar/nucleoside kinase (ribokinase family)
VALDTVAAAAGKAEVQPSAMVRFAQALGYDGYTDMQRIFRDRLVQRSGSYRERIASLRRASPKLSRPKAVLHDFVSDSIAHLSHLEEHVSPELLERAVTCLAGAGHIHVLAQRRAFPVACYLSYALAQLELPVSLLDNVGGMVREQARAMRPGDVLVAVSFRNYTPDVIELAADAFRRGVKVVVITDSAVSPLARSATVAFDWAMRATARSARWWSPCASRSALVVSVGHELTAPAPARARGPHAPPELTCHPPSTSPASAAPRWTSTASSSAAPLEDVSTFARYLGGSPANTAVGAARLGLAVAMISRVGDEQNGRFVRATLEREGVDVSQVTTDPQRLTALVFLAIRGPDDFPHIFYRDNCATWRSRHRHRRGVRRALPCGARLGHAPSREGPRAACERARRRPRGPRRSVVLDIDYRPVLWGLVGTRKARREPRPRSAAAAASARCSRSATSWSAPRRSSAGGFSQDLERAARERRAGPRPGCGEASARRMHRLRRPDSPGSSPRSARGIRGRGFNTLGAAMASWRGSSPGGCTPAPEICCRLANACGALVVSRHGCSPRCRRRRSCATSSSAARDAPAAGGPGTRPRASRDHAPARSRPSPLRARLRPSHAGSRRSLRPTRRGDQRIAQFKSLRGRCVPARRAGPAGRGLILDDR